MYSLKLPIFNKAVALNRLNVIRRCLVRANTMAAAPTAGILIIGDEILKAQTRDTNSHYLCKRLFEFGIKVEKILVVSDNVDVIAEEVRSFTKQFTYVFTSGGIGPTHDDVTFEAVASAFNDKVILNPELEGLVRKYFKTNDANHPSMRLARIPSTAQLNYGYDQTKGMRNWYPIVSVQNVYVFPGVPHLCQKAFELLTKDLFKGVQTKFYTDELFISRDEITIVPFLDKVVKKFENRVQLGSYPDFFHSYYKVRISFQAQSMEELQAAKEQLTNELPPDVIVSYDKDCVKNASAKLGNLLDSVSNSELGVVLREAVRSVESVLEKYSLNEICLSFNGGKDCTALLHLMHAVLQKNGSYGDQGKLTVFYVKETSPFPQMEEFIAETSVRYDFNLKTYSGTLRDALSSFKSEHPQIKVVFMGQRKTDPNGHRLTHECHTDSGWPEFLRAFPLLNWSYHDVWTFLRSLYVPYCSLYDRGYSSLGGRDSTQPNSDLETTDQLGRIVYKPAYMLNDSAKERNGRH